MTTSNGGGDATCYVGRPSIWYVGRLKGHHKARWWICEPLRMKLKQDSRNLELLEDGSSMRGIMLKRPTPPARPTWQQTVAGSGSSLRISRYAWAFTSFTDCRVWSKAAEEFVGNMTHYDANDADGAPFKVASSTIMLTRRPTCCYYKCIRLDPDRMHVVHYVHSTR